MKSIYLGRKWTWRELFITGCALLCTLYIAIAVSVSLSSCGEETQPSVTPYVTVAVTEDINAEEGDLPQQAEAFTLLADYGDEVFEPELKLCPRDEAYDPEYDDCFLNVAEYGANPYYKVDISSPEAFYNTTASLWGFDEGFGRQCVSFFKEFMYSLSGKIVATSTGGASGYANQQSTIEPLGFTWHKGTEGIQNGDWVIVSSGTYGHVAMWYNGKFYGQNQSGGNIYVGSGPSLVTPSGVIFGYYRPNIYNVTPAPAPEPAPAPNTRVHTVERGHTVCGDYGIVPCVRSRFEPYADNLLDLNTNTSVLWGWQHKGVGYIAGHNVEDNNRK